MIDTVHGNKSVALWRVNIKWFVPFLSPFFNARGVAIVCFCLSVSYISMDFNRAHLLNLGSWQFPSKTVYSYHIGLDLVTAIFLDIPSISLTPNVPDLEKPLRPLIRLFALLPFRWKVLAVRPAISKVLCTFPSSQWNNGIFQEMSDQEGVIPCRWCRFLPVNSMTHRSAMLSISFSRISHQMCCAGERVRGGKKSLDFPEKNARNALRECEHRGKEK